MAKNEEKVVDAEVTGSKVEPKPEKKVAEKKVTGETVTLPKETLEKLISSNEQLLNRVALLEKGPRYSKPLQVKDHTAKIATFNGTPVIGWDDAKGGEDGDLNINIHLLNGDTFNVNYTKFFNKSVRVPVKIISQKATERRAVDERDGGGGLVRKVNPENDKVVGEVIELEVVYVDYESVIEIMEGENAGQQFTIKNQYLNP